LDHKFRFGWVIEDFKIGILKGFVCLCSDLFNEYPMRVKTLLVSMCFFLGMLACQEDFSTQPPHLEPSFHDSIMQAVIEIPVGFQQWSTYDPSQGQVVETEKTLKLPLPGNWGFIPSTQYTTAKKSDPLDVLVLSDAIPSGEQLSILPVGVVLLQKEGAVIPLILAIPADPALQTISIQGFNDLSIQYEGIKRLLEDWIVQVFADSSTRILDWKNEQYASTLVLRNQTPYSDN
jgi:inorganic pyrophosphatase